MSKLLNKVSSLKEAFDLVTKNPGINVDNLSGGGLLSTRQADRFISFIQESTPLLSAVRIERMKSPSETFPGLIVAEELTRAVGINNTLSQGQRDEEDQGNFLRGHTSYEIGMNAKEFSLAYALSENMLQDNIEGQGFASTIAKYFAKLYGIDSEAVMLNGNVVDRNPGSPLATTLDGAHNTTVTTVDVADASGFPALSDPGAAAFPGYLTATTGAGVVEYMTYTTLTVNAFTGVTRNAINRDTGVVGVTGSPVGTGSTYSGGEVVAWYKHHLFGGIDGWLYKIENPGSEPGANFVDGATINGGSISEDHFFAALKEMPNKYLDQFPRAQLRWIMNEKKFIDMQQRIATRVSGGPLADNVLQGLWWEPENISVLTSTKFPEDKILLTAPQNLMAGFWMQIQIRNTNVGKTAILTNRRFYNIRARFDCEVERKDFAVVINNLS